MKRSLRRKVIIQQIEKKLETYDRRIKQMAVNAYKLRQFLDKLNSEVQDIAIHSSEGQGSVGSGSSDIDSGGINVPDSTVVEAVLEEQPTELPSNSGDLGVSSGSAV